MKRLIAIAVMSLIIISCNNSAEDSKGIKDSVLPGNTDGGPTIAPGNLPGQDTAGLNMDRTRNDSGLRK